MAAHLDGQAMDGVFRALADPGRRRLLDSLNTRNGQTLRELCADMDMARQSVSKHLAVLEAANLVTTVWRGREKLHYLNPAPINDISERWIDRYEQQRVHALADLKRALEGPSMDKPSFVYTTYIQTTPERLWEALTSPAFTERYWSARFETDWAPGSEMVWNLHGVKITDPGQVVLESDPYRRLSFTWHNFTPELARAVGVSDDVFAIAAGEPRSKVTFELEPMGSAVRLTVIHENFPPASKAAELVSGGWPQVLSKLKTMLETGETFRIERATRETCDETGAPCAAKRPSEDRRNAVSTHKTGTREEWLAAREQLLAREKEHTRLGEKLAQQRRELPWMPVEKEYRLNTEHGPMTLAELFDSRSQLVVYHFMFGPDYEAGCPVCSSIADSFNGVLAQLKARDVTMICISRAPLEKLLAYRERMGWSFNWASSFESDFNYDFERSRTRDDVSAWGDEAPPVVSRFAAACGTDPVGYLAEGPGLSVFALSDNQVYLTYATTARGLEPVMVYYGILDRAPSGRDEGDPPDPSWIRRHDEYEAA